MTGWPFATCLTFGPRGNFACGIFSEDHALEAWERMTTGGLHVPCLPGFPYAHAVETPKWVGAHIAFSEEWR